MNTPIYNEESGQHWRPDDPARAFRVPDGYFEHLSDRIADQIAAKGLERTESAELSVVPQKQRPVIEVLKPYLYLAAMFVGIAFFVRLIPVVRPLQDNNQQTIASQAHDSSARPTEQLTDEEYQMFISEMTTDEYVAASVDDLY